MADDPRARDAGERPPPGWQGPEGERPPPAGWQRPEGERPPPAGWQRAGGAPTALDVELLLELLGALREPLAAMGEPLAAVREPLASARERIPADLQQRLAEAGRELLLALRALIDWQLERTDPSGPARGDRDGERPADAGPRDIPIV